MATTGSDFVYTTGTNGVLDGTAVLTPPLLSAAGGKEAFSQSQLDQVVGGSGAATAANNTVAGRLVFDPALTAVPPVGATWPVPEVYGTVLGGYAKNGAVYLALSGTTPQTVSLQNTTTNSPAGTAGDTAFATVNVVRVKNLGASAVTVAPGGSNPSPIPAFTGTTPTVSIPAGSEILFHSAAGATISTAANLTFTPAASGSLLVTIGGA